MQVVPLSGDEIGLLAAASDGQGTVKQNQWAQKFNEIPLQRLTFVITHHQAYY